MTFIAEAQADKAEINGGIFTRQSLLLALFIVVLPNILYFAASPVFAVTRLLSPLLFLAVGIVGLFIPRWMTFVLFAVVMVVDLALVIMVMFHLPLDVALDSAQYLATIDIKSSAFYLAVIAAALGTSLGAAHLVSKNREKLRTASLLPATLAAFVIVGTDYAFTFPYFQKPELPFESALGQSGITAETVAAGDKNLLIVMVEGLGAFKSPDERRIFAETLTKNLPSNKYTFKSGTTFYSGSTTGAASRELCGQWGDYLDYLDGPDRDCLPRQIAEKGYETISYHGFETSMFERDNWYPRIGFTEFNFIDNLASNAQNSFGERCGSVFEGLCDSDMGALVHNRLTDVPNTNKFIYWLTLNSHIPFVPTAEDPLGCRTPQPRVQVGIVCELANIWLPVFQQVNAIATDPDLPPTDILVVGDHHTPLWERSAKKRFIPNRVDWYLLRAQD